MATVLLVLSGSFFSVYALDAVASIVRTSGGVHVKRSHRILPGRKGLMLQAKDTVVTLQTGKVTVLLRDGTEIRLDENTRFAIEKSYEVEGAKRSFTNVLMLHAGSLLGFFPKGLQSTTVITPTATAEIKGTNVEFVEREGSLDISLFEGALAVANEREEVFLYSGSSVLGITKQEKFSDKIGDIPYRIEIEPQSELTIPKNGTSSIGFSIRLIDIETKGNVEKAGSVYMRSNIGKVVFPDVRLNERGKADFQALVYPFHQADYDKSRLEIVAIMEGSDAMDVGSGGTVLGFAIPESRTRILRIDANTGAIVE